MDNVDIPLFFQRGGGTSYWCLGGTSTTLSAGKTFYLFPGDGYLMLWNDTEKKEVWVVPCDTNNHNLTYEKGTSSNQLFSLRFTVRNSSSSRNGHTLALMVRDDRMALYDSTAGQWVW